METKFRTLTAVVGLFTLSLIGSALADSAPAAAGTPAKPAAAAAPVKPAVAAAPADKPAAAPAVTAAPAGQPTREQLLEDLKKANTQLADDKKAVTAVAKTDKPALKTAQDKVKADGKAINEINLKLHAIKVDKKGAAAKPAAPAPATKS
jgi:hypothetical protein